MIVNRVPELIAKRLNVSPDKINASQVQRETGLEYQTVQRWLKNRIVSAEFAVLDVWCDYLGVDVGDILGRKAGE